MNNAEFLKLLEKLGAEDLVIQNISIMGQGLADWWSTTTNGDDMAWLLAYLVPKQRIALVLADVVDPALAKVPKDKRQGVEVETLRRWGRGEVKKEAMLDASSIAQRTYNDAASSSTHTDTEFFSLRAACAAYLACCSLTFTTSLAYSACADDLICGVDVPLIIRRHVSAEEIVALAKNYMANNP